jgi:putative thiamine transport system permease protein
VANLSERSSHFDVTFNSLGRIPLVMLFALPLAASLLFIAPVFFDASAFAEVLAHPQFYGAFALTLFTGITSTALSLLIAILVVANTPQQKSVGAMLAVPHLSLAMGLAFLIMPTGVLARLLAIPFNWSSPPQWVTSQDPYGLSLIAALVLKETPFLVWTFASLLQRDDLRASLRGQKRVAASLGHGGLNTWVAVLLPQLLSRMRWPLVAVFAYGMTVVDMALVIGPTQPPTLAQLIWSDLNDSDGATNARGAAATLGLSFMILILSWVVGTLLRFRELWARFFVPGYRSAKKSKNAFLSHLWGFWRLFYACVGILLLIQSFSTLWPFPRLLPAAASLQSWRTVFENLSPLLTTLWLALSTSTAAMISSVAWLETQPQRHDRFMLLLSGTALCLPALLIALGQYKLFLAGGITGTGTALFFAHSIPVTAYAFIMLHGSYRGFDARWQAVSSGLMASRRTFLTSIKWPLLKAPLLSTWAVAFAVSVVQFVPAQLAAAGRFSTLPMEAVTLSSGGNRGLIAAYALTLAVLPLLAFTIASRFGRARWH